MLTAEYGGTGGLPIESGMVVEEPDIEIGAGVSSKGMSQLPPTFSFLFFPSPLLLF
jgi:protein NRD1